MAAGFGRVAYLVLDEADRLLEPTFESELRAILQVGFAHTVAVVKSLTERTPLPSRIRTVPISNIYTHSRNCVLDMRIPFVYTMPQMFIQCCD